MANGSVTATVMIKPECLCRDSLPLSMGVCFGFHRTCDRSQDDVRQLGAGPLYSSLRAMPIKWEQFTLEIHAVSGTCSYCNIHEFTLSSWSLYSHLQKFNATPSKILFCNLT